MSTERSGVRQLLNSQRVMAGAAEDRQEPRSKGYDRVALTANDDKTGRAWQSLQANLAGKLEDRRRREEQHGVQEPQAPGLELFPGRRVPGTGRYEGQKMQRGVGVAPGTLPTTV